MAAINVTMPDELKERIDDQAERWYTNRSQAMVRMIVEWFDSRARQLPLAVAETPEDTIEDPAVQRRCDAKELVEVA